jgi:large subunit ribosomal protein L29
MKMSELRELTEEELNTQIEESNKALFEAKFQLAMHQLENTAEIGRLKNRLAQLKTILNQKTRQA